MKKITLIAGIGSRVVVAVMAVSVLSVMVKADGNKQELKGVIPDAKLEAKVTKLANSVHISNEELVKDVKLTKSKSHYVYEPFTCEVALADKKELNRVIRSNTKHNLAHRAEYKRELKTVIKGIKLNKCGEK